jgi:hypothetical protein
VGQNGKYDTIASKHYKPQSTKHFRKVSLGEALFGVDVMLSFSIINLLIGDHISGVDILVFDNCLFLSAMYVGHCL